MALTDNLVSYWKCDESSGNLSDSVASNTLTNTNTATFVAGKINNGINLVRASSQYFTITDAAQTGLDFAGSFSFSLWVNLTSLPSVAGGQFDIVSKDNVSVSRSYSLDAQTSDKLELIVFNTPNQMSGLTNSAFFVSGDVGSWVHTVGTYDSSTGTTVLYKNDASQALTQFGTTVSPLNGTAPFNIGCRFSSSVAQNFTNGKLDEIGVWSRVLTSTEVTQLYNGGAGLQYPFTGPAATSKNFLTLGVGT